MERISPPLVSELKVVASDVDAIKMALLKEGLADMDDLDHALQ